MERLRKRNRPCAKPVDEPPKPKDEGQVVLKCQVCEKVYSRLDTLRAHQLHLHGEGSIKCFVCSDEFSSKSALQRHELTHSNERDHQCQECLKTFKRRDTLTYHERTVHSEKHGLLNKASDQKEIVITSQCEGCIRRKCSGHLLTSVIRNGKPYVCHQCIICLAITSYCEFNWKHHHIHHSVTDMPKENGFQCERCFRLFGSRKTLQRHCGQTCYSPNSSEPLYQVSDVEMEAWIKSNGATAPSSP